MFTNDKLGHTFYKKTDLIKSTIKYYVSTLKITLSIWVLIKKKLINSIKSK